MDFLYNFVIGGISAAITSIDYNFGASMRPRLNNDENVKWYVESFRKATHRCYSYIQRISLANIPRYSLIQGLNFSLNDAYRQIFCPFGYLLLLTLDSQNEKFLFFLGNFASGSMAGATSALFIYPQDIARSYLIEDKFNTQKKYHGLTDCIRKLYMKNGFKSLYTGFGISVSSVALYRGIQFGSYYTANGTIFNSPDAKNNYMAKFLFATLVTDLAGIISSPLDIIRQNLKIQQGRTDIKQINALDCAIEIFKKEGMNIIYIETLINLTKRTSGALILIFYDLIKNLIEESSEIQQKQ